jgi:hypothetical protein
VIAAERGMLETAEGRLAEGGIVEVFRVEKPASNPAQTSSSLAAET